MCVCLLVRVLSTPHELAPERVSRLAAQATKEVMGEKGISVLGARCSQDPPRALNPNRLIFKGPVLVASAPVSI
jgi:hypothetical protein